MSCTCRNIVLACLWGCFEFPPWSAPQSCKAHPRTEAANGELVSKLPHCSLLCAKVLGCGRVCVHAGQLPRWGLRTDQEFRCSGYTPSSRASPRHSRGVPQHNGRRNLKCCCGGSIPKLLQIRTFQSNIHILLAWLGPGISVWNFWGIFWGRGLRLA